MAAISNFEVTRNPTQENTKPGSVKITVVRTKEAQGVPLHRQYDTVKTLYSRNKKDWEGFSKTPLVTRTLHPKKEGKAPVERDKGKEEAVPMPKNQIFVFKTDEGRRLFVSESSLREAKETLARRGYGIGQSQDEVFLSEVLEAFEDGMRLEEIVQIVREGEKNELLTKLLGYLESQLVQTVEAKEGVSGRALGRLEAEELSLQESIQYVEDFLSRKDLGEIKADPYVDTLLKVIDYKERHPEWHRTNS